MRLVVSYLEFLEEFPVLERVMGTGPTLPPWQGGVQPIYCTRNFQ